ncbi:MAG: hypothetical protein HC846_13245 [Blastocatellia bacterium]|nr:hypothetical protein [Blastocatellia bacterium]
MGKDLATFGQWNVLKLSAEDCKKTLILREFAIGFCSSTKSVIVRYTLDNLYPPESEQGIS